MLEAIIVAAFYEAGIGDGAFEDVGAALCYATGPGHGLAGPHWDGSDEGEEELDEEESEEHGDGHLGR